MPVPRISWIKKPVEFRLVGDSLLQDSASGELQRLRRLNAVETLFAHLPPQGVVHPQPFHRRHPAPITGLQTVGTSGGVARVANATNQPLVQHQFHRRPNGVVVDRKSTRLNSSHGYISYAVFCLKKKKNTSSLVTRFASANLECATSTICRCSMRSDYIPCSLHPSHTFSPNLSIWICPDICTDIT